jgi:hypothetical protein
VLVLKHPKRSRNLDSWVLMLNELSEVAHAVFIALVPALRPHLSILPFLRLLMHGPGTT